MNKKLFLTAAVALFSSGNLTSAADMAVRAAAAPAPVAPTYTWTGLYLGGGWGYGMYNLDTRASTVPPVFSVNQTLGGRGWLGTAVVGGDYQVNNWLVLGAFGDYDWANIKQSGQNPVLGAIKENSAWAVGGRAGYAVTPAFLTYVNGGYTQAHFSATGGVIPSHAFSGWFIGSGVETKMSGLLGILGPGWLWRNEYRFSDYHNTTLSNAPLLSASIHPFVQTVRTEFI